MDDPRGRPLDIAPELPVLAEFWPSAALARDRLSRSSGFGAADEVLRGNIDYPRSCFVTVTGGVRARIWEKSYFPNTVALTPRDRPGLYQRVREAVALLPPGVLDLLGKGPDLCLATYAEPMTSQDRTGTRKMGMGQGSWLLLVGHEAADAPDDAARGVLLHELLHIVVGRSEAFRPYWKARLSRDMHIARAVNDEIEELVIRLACELGFVPQTEAYLGYLERTCQDGGGNARFLELVEDYPLTPSLLSSPAARPGARRIRSSPPPFPSRASRRGPPR